MVKRELMGGVGGQQGDVVPSLEAAERRRRTMSLGGLRRRGRAAGLLSGGAR